MGPSQARNTGIRRYYDRNTAWMLRFGAGRGEAVIHRPVWTPQAQTRRLALHTVHDLIAESLLPAAAASPPPETGDGRGSARPFHHLVDLGCGAGGTALWLAGRYPVRITGITLSPLQAARAQKLAAAHGLSGRCRFGVGNFTHLPTLGQVEAAYAVESFSHGNDPQRFFKQIGAILPAEARLILCDDFLVPERGNCLRKRRKLLNRFHRGWYLGSLLEADTALALASNHGFALIEKKDLTPHLRPASPILVLAQRLVGRLLPRTAWGASLSGSSALQICLKNGWVQYLFLVLEKRPA